MTDEIKAALAACVEAGKGATPGPWRTNTTDEVGRDWLIGTIMDLGSAETPDVRAYSKWIVTTDCLHASECAESTAATDAAFVAASANLARHAPALLAMVVENARLREALEKIMLLAPCDRSDDDDDEHVFSDGYDEALADMKEIALAALGGNADDR